MTNFKTIEYLKSGSLIQKLAYKELSALAIFEHLKTYNPLLAGTIPIGINISESDLDILCFCNDHTKFKQHLTEIFGRMSDFEIYNKIFQGINSTIARFEGEHFEIEIFGQNIPSEKQNAFRHMLIENRILQEKGEQFRQEILDLKKSGIKTEAAFAKLLGIKGDPYQELLRL